MSEELKSSENSLAEHLSAEITAYTEYLATFRSRIAFAVLIGPFALLGSYIVSKGSGTVNLSQLPISSVVFAILAVICYLGLGYYGAELDSHVTNQCNKWRRQIIKCSKGQPVDESEVLFEHRSKASYLVGIVLFLGGFLFLCCALFVR